MGMRWVVRGLLAALLLGVVSAAGAAGRSADGVGAACRGAAAAPAATYRHVIWIWMENHAYDAALAASDAPFTNQLAAQCGLATNYHNITHPSLPNYIAATSGGTQGISDDCEPRQCSRAAQSLFGQVAKAGMTWAAYQESMPSPCDLAAGAGTNPSGEYAPKHDPAAYYLPLRSSCAQRVLPLGSPSAGALARALKSRSLARFTFITPNLCNDTHDCPVSTGDAWLSRWVRKIVSSPTYRRERTAIFITWDEGEGGGSDDCAANTSDAGCHVATLIVSPSIRRGARSAALFNHYSLLRTTEQLLGITTFLGHAGDAGTRSMRAQFHL
jgi:phosphatidylinositol-3-phosphatase